MSDRTSLDRLLHHPTLYYRKGRPAANLGLALLSTLFQLPTFCEGRFLNLDGPPTRNANPGRIQANRSAKKKNYFHNMRAIRANRLKRTLPAIRNSWPTKHPRIEKRRAPFQYRYRPEISILWFKIERNPASVPKTIAGNQKRSPAKTIASKNDRK